MDIKVEGLTTEVMMEALTQAKKGRMHILGKILETIPEPRPELKPFAPRIIQLTIPKDMIGAVIGPGGKVIQEIQAESGATIMIEEKDNQGLVKIFGENQECIEKALGRVKGIVHEPEVGEIYKGKVKSIVTFGAFVEILPGKQGLLHISEIDWRRIKTVDEVLKEGEEVEVKIIEIEKGNGRFKLSRKALIPKPDNDVSNEKAGN
jgi:polyribonucleotide nucleotidyltransferase